MIIGLLIIMVLFIGTLLYKLSDPNWYGQFITGKFEDEDLFTRIIKFLMS